MTRREAMQSMEILVMMGYSAKKALIGWKVSGGTNRAVCRSWTMEGAWTKAIMRLDAPNNKPFLSQLIKSFSTRMKIEIGNGGSMCFDKTGEYSEKFYCSIKFKRYGEDIHICSQSVNETKAMFRSLHKLTKYFDVTDLYPCPKCKAKRKYHERD